MAGMLQLRDTRQAHLDVRIAPMPANIEIKAGVCGFVPDTGE